MWNVNFKILEENVTCVYYYYCGISLKRLKKTIKENFDKLYQNGYIKIQHEGTEQNDIFSRDTNSCSKLSQAQGKLKFETAGPSGK